MNATPAGLPEPPAGSPRYFAWLYTPGPQRRRVQGLLGIADELAASLQPGLEHEVAHIRLEWWQLEAERLRHGAGTHPWVRELQTGGGALDPAHSGEELAQLVLATALALAQARQDPAAVAAQERALFPALAALLAGPALPPQARILLAAVGERVHALEAAAATSTSAGTGSISTGTGTRQEPATLAVDAEVLQRQLQQLDRASLPVLAPLLVWSALALRQAQRRTAGQRLSLGSGIADNVLAWRSARAAARRQLPSLKVRS